MPYTLGHCEALLVPFDDFSRLYLFYPQCNAVGDGHHRLQGKLIKWMAGKHCHDPY